MLLTTINEGGSVTVSEKQNPPITHKPALLTPYDRSIAEGKPPVEIVAEIDKFNTVVIKAVVGKEKFTLAFFDSGNLELMHVTMQEHKEALKGFLRFKDDNMLKVVR